MYLLISLSLFAGNPQELVKQAKIIAQATSQMVDGIKEEAGGLSDHDARSRLLLAAKVLAVATVRMVEAAKVHTTTYSQTINRSFESFLPLGSCS